MLTQRPFPNVSDQVHEDGVNAMPRCRDAVDVAARESTRLVNDRGSVATVSVPHRWSSPRRSPLSRRAPRASSVPVLPPLLTGRC